MGIESYKRISQETRESGEKHEAANDNIPDQVENFQSMEAPKRTTEEQDALENVRERLSLPHEHERNTNSGEILVKQEKDNEMITQDINAGDKVYFQGNEWTVYDRSKPHISEETDTNLNYRALELDKKPEELERRKVKSDGGVTLMRSDGNTRNMLGGHTYSDVEKITPENSEKINKLIEDFNKE
jgi:hypothetical protein